MERNIPTRFEGSIVSSPIESTILSNKKVHELKVRVFTKGQNRNGSFITDAVAQRLIDTAVEKSVPVVGFFDNESKTWSGHTGPTIAQAYGYCKEFIGWQPFTDTDGIERDYAVFNIVLFSDYFEETQYVQNANQSMELNPETITGDWANFDGEDYFVYKTADMFGFCIIGSHEPCFSVSAFFEKQSEDVYAKISSLLFELRQQVEENKILEGGEQAMQDNVQFEEQIVEETPAVVEEAIVEAEPAVEPEAEVVETFEEETPAVVEEEIVEDAPAAIETPEEEAAVVEEEEASTDFEALYNQLREDYDNLVSQLEAERNAHAEDNGNFENTISGLNDRIATLENSVQEFEALRAQQELDQKNELVESFENLLDDEEISEVRSNVTDFTYGELKSKLAIMYSDKQLANAKAKQPRVPVVNTDNEFAEFMAKYKKN